MSQAELGFYVDRLKLTPEGIEYLKGFLTGPDGDGPQPSRNVQSKLGNLIIRYPSRKMRMVLPLESRRTELVRALMLERSEDVIEYYSQPTSIVLRYQKRCGRRVTTPYTPDFLVLANDRVEWIECRPSKRMEALMLSMPGRYARSGPQLWSCPPAEIVANSFGFKYSIWTELECTPYYASNLEFLDPYLRLSSDRFAESDWQPVYAFIHQHPGVTKEDLIANKVIQDYLLLYWMVAQRIIYCDLDKYHLGGLLRVPFFSSVIAAKTLEANEVPSPIWSSLSIANPEVKVSTKLGNLLHLMLSVDKAELEEMYLRWRMVKGLLPKDKWNVGERSVERYRAAYEAKGYCGLRRNQDGKQGNHISRKPRWVRKLAFNTIRDFHLSVGKKPVSQPYDVFRARFPKIATKLKYAQPVPRRPWFDEVVEDFGQQKIITAQQGNRAAYNFTPTIGGLETLWERSGFYPFGQVHCDHTRLSVELRSMITGQRLKNPWLTLLIDGYSRTVLAKHLSFFGPSRASVMMVMRDCVRRHGRLPIGMTVDNAGEFRSEYFETLTGGYDVIVTRRPKGKPRFGHVVERFFGTIENNVMPLLAGCTHILKTPRIATKQVQPGEHSVWTLYELDQLLEHVLFEMLNRSPHTELGTDRSVAFEEAVNKHGLRDIGLVDYEQFWFESLPEIPDEYVTVQKPNFVRIFRDEFYHDDLVGAVGEKLRARYDPMDIGAVLVERRTGEWLTCHSKFRTKLQDLNQIERAILAEELRARFAACKRDADLLSLTRGELVEKIKNTKEPELRARIQELLGTDSMDYVILNPADPTLTGSDTPTDNMQFCQLEEVGGYQTSPATNESEEQ